MVARQLPKLKTRVRFPSPAPAYVRKRTPAGKPNERAERAARRNEMQDGKNMHYVYILQSISYPDQYYTGMTSNLKERLKYHNAGHVPHTSKFVPWKVLSYFALASKEKAAHFEKS